MLELAQGNYTKEQVIKQLHLVDGVREVRFRYDLLNKYNIKKGELLNCDSGQINFNSENEIKKTGKFRFKDEGFDKVDWLNDRVQPFFMLKMTNGDWLEWSQGIFLMSSPKKIEKNKQIYREVEAYDLSLILREDTFSSRYRIASGTNYIVAITSIINSAGISNVNLQANTAITNGDKEFEIGTPKIVAINSLLKEIGYNDIYVSNLGYFNSKTYTLPMLREADYSYKTDSKSIIFSGASSENDLFSMPNCWVAVISNPEKAPLISKFTNDSISSLTSTVNRDRIITRTVKIDDILDKSTLDTYVRKIAYEQMQQMEIFNFNSALMPHHENLDCLFVEHTDLNTNGKYIETSWSMDLKASGQMVHKCKRVIVI